MMNSQQVNQALANSPEPRVTQDQIEKRITKTSFTKVGDTVTVANIELDNGFSVRGESACVNIANYNKEIGEALSYKNAFLKLWPLFGFLLAEDNFRSQPTSKSA